MKRRLMVFIVAVLVALVATSCGRIDDVIVGSGRVVTETRNVSGFDAISHLGFGDLSIAQGDTQSLTIEAEDNILPRIVTEVHNGALIIRWDRPYKMTSFRTVPIIRYHVTLKRLTRLEHEGAGDIHATNLQGDRLEVRLSGAGNIDLDGRVRSLEANLNGAGNYRGERLNSQIARVTVAGIGDATVWATDKLDVRISGLGNVDYYGNPTVSKEITAVGAVRSLGDK